MPIPDPSPDARAVVTGASQNIGAALATELAARGHSLIVTARREDLLNTLAARLTDKYGVAVDVRPADLADPADRAKLCDELAARPISILCANAGTATCSANVPGRLLPTWPRNMARRSPTRTPCVVATAEK